MLQCDVVCCSVLQCVAGNCVCVIVLQCVAMCCHALQCGAACCRVLPCVAVCCRVLQCVAVCCSVLRCVAVCCVRKWMCVRELTCDMHCGGALGVGALYAGTDILLLTHLLQ